MWNDKKMNSDKETYGWCKNQNLSIDKIYLNKMIFSYQAWLKGYFTFILFKMMGFSWYEAEEISINLNDLRVEFWRGKWGIVE